MIGISRIGDLKSVAIFQLIFDLLPGPLTLRCGKHSFDRIDGIKRPSLSREGLIFNKA